MSKVVDFSNPNAQDLSLSGGKGASLAKLSHINGVNVPGGFIITTENERIPAEEIKAELAKFAPDTLFAVRSSATAEDLPDASFAGQMDSFLNVAGYDAVVSAIEKCRNSLYNERAVSYREKNNISSPKMAVVVQKMVNAKYAGVMFTADPMTSDRFTVVVEVVEGLGEALVSGRKTPETYKIKDGNINGERTLLTDAQVEKLVRIGRLIEKEYGCPQDIEWCYDNGEFYIVQSRPVTTLYPAPPSHDGFKRCFISVGHLQMMTDAILPLGFSFLQMMEISGSSQACFTNVGGHSFMEITHDISRPVMGRIFAYEFKSSDYLMFDALQQLRRRKKWLKSVPKGRSSFTFPKGMVWHMLGGIKMYKNNGVGVVERYVGAVEKNLKEFDDKISKLSGVEILDCIAADKNNIMNGVIYQKDGIALVMSAFIVADFINRAGRKLLGKEDIIKDISKSIPNNVTSEMGRSLSRISDAMRDFPEVINYLENCKTRFSLDELCNINAEIAALFDDFLNKYGMRATGEIDITKPRFAEDQAGLVSTILANIKLPKGQGELIWEKGLKESSAAISELYAAAGQKQGRGKLKKLKKQVEYYRNFFGYREIPKYFWMNRYWSYKKALIREAEKLAEKGAIRTVDDIYYLTFNELRELFAAGKVDPAKIDRLRKEYEHYKTLTPPRMIFSDGEVIEGKRRIDAPKGSLAGQGVSSGVIEGTAKVITDMSEADLIEAGDILVTRFTDPSWTPVFVSIAGLVTEVGGMMTHGAVITREYGLPAVVGVLGATQLIKTGDKIRVDGDNGWIEWVLSEGPCLGK